LDGALDVTGGLPEALAGGADAATAEQQEQQQGEQEERHKS
jgi:hypothetical protein